jgi:hypothetical protein
MVGIILQTTERDLALMLLQLIHTLRTSSKMDKRN